MILGDRQTPFERKLALESAPLHTGIMSANSRGQSRRAFRLRLMSPRAYRDREAKVSLFQRCRSGGRRRLTAPM
eukprot:6458019-Prymnesium_polylepis.1